MTRDVAPSRRFHPSDRFLWVSVVASVLGFCLICPPRADATTYYVRTDGGSSDRCTGLADAADPGSGSGQACAWDHPFRALPPGGTPRIAAGDTLIIAAGSYMMGYGANGADSCSSDSAWSCYMPPIPSGLDASHPTRILGAGHDTGCANPPELWGTERAEQILNLTDSSYVEVACFVVTDHSGCVESHSGTIACNRDTYPYGTWAVRGLYAEDSSSVSLKNLNIHGLAVAGILAGRLTDWTVQDVRIAGNGWVGWDGDIGATTSSNSGNLTFRRLTVEWNGCGETYPGGQPTGCWAQSAGGYGDGFGTGATAGTWLFEDSKFLHNTSDGLDLLYGRQGSSITIRRTIAEGNAGNQIKTNGPALIENSIMVGNCAFFEGKSFTHNVDNCRAMGNTLSLTLRGGDSVTLTNSTLKSEGDCVVIADCDTQQSTCVGTESVRMRNNIFIGDTEFLSPTDTSCLMYQDATFPHGDAVFDVDYSLVTSVKDDACPGTHHVCGGSSGVTNSTLTAFDAHLPSSSAAIDAGTATGAPTVDFDGLARDAIPDLGAYEYRLCTLTLGASSASVAAAATTGTVTVTAVGSSCAWTATSNATWITITSGASGSTSGTVGYSVAANTSSAARTGTLTIAGQTFTVVQAAGAATRRVAGDFDGDGQADRAVFRPPSGMWYIEGQASHQWGLPGDIPVPADYNGDGAPDLAVFRPSTGQWFIEGQSTIQWGLPGDLPLVGDFDGDGRADAAVFRTSDSLFATWYVRGVTTTQLGVRGDIPMPADYDGDGRTDLAVYRPSEGNWYIKTSASGFTNSPTPIQWGLPGDIPVTGSFDSDGKADLVVFRPATGMWYVVYSGSTYNASGADAFQLGLPGDIPMTLDLTGDGVDEIVLYRPPTGIWYHRDGVGGTSGSAQYGLPGDSPIGARPQLPCTATADFDADGRADMTVFRPSSGVWYTRLSSGNYTTTSSSQFGLDGDIDVAGDYDGDRKTDLAVYRPASGVWYFQRSSNGTFGEVQWGLPTDQPVPADYDGDGRTDLAVFRPSTGEWYVSRSSTDYATWFSDQWGLPSDTALPADYDGDGRADLAVYRPSSGEWYLKLSSGAFGGTITKQWGLPDDVPAAADFDGDGRADLGVYRPSTGQWYTVDALTSYNPLTVQWGLPGDTPVPHDFDGDGRADAAVFRPDSGEWYIRGSSNGLMIYQQWGLPTDRPVAWSKDELQPW